MNLNAPLYEIPKLYGFNGCDAHLSWARETSFLLKGKGVELRIETSFEFACEFKELEEFESFETSIEFQIFRRVKGLS